jgi:adenylyltransferase/sulfurtransferase
LLEKFKINQIYNYKKGKTLQLKNNIFNELSNDEIEAYSRQIVLDEIGYEGQLKIKNAKVLIAGVGGLGSPTALKLAAMGVGFIKLVDRDIVSTSDLHRQHLYDFHSIGLVKVEVATEKLKALNPRITVIPIPISIKQWNAHELIKDVDLVIDGLDSIEARYIINRACIERNIPYIYGAAIENQGVASTIIPYESACLECFNPGLTDEELPKCSIVGVHPSILNIISSIQTFEAIRLITGKKPKLINKLLYVDLNELSFDEVKVVVRNQNCPSCGSKQIKPQLKEELIEEHCARSGKKVFIITPKKWLTIDLLKASIQLKEFKIEKFGKLGATFSREDGITLSILKTGVAIIQVPPNLNKLNSKKDVLDLYKTIFIDKLNMPIEALPL